METKQGEVGSTKKQKIGVNGTVLTVQYPTIGKQFSVDFAKYSDKMRAAAMVHGFKQKFGDAASGGTPEEKLAEVRAIHESLMNDEWERTGERDMTAVICEAVSRLKKIPLPKILKAAEVAPDQVKEWRVNAKVKAEIAKIYAERAKKRAEEAEESDISVKFD